jgi:hypothetical protein
VINITYLPATDPFHAVFRTFVLFPDNAAGKCPVETARILDFYVCFPFLISAFKCPKGLVRAHNSLKRLYPQNTYQITPKPAVLFNRMRGSQIAAISSLISYGFLESGDYKAGIVARTQKDMPAKTAAGVLEYHQDHAELMSFLAELKTYSPYGPNGLKARSELEEHRYDNV